MEFFKNLNHNFSKFKHKNETKIKEKITPLKSVIDNAIINNKNQNISTIRIHKIKIILNKNILKTFSLRVNSENLIEQLKIIQNLYKKNLKEILLVFVKSIVDKISLNLKLDDLEKLFSNSNINSTQKFCEDILIKIPYEDFLEYFCEIKVKLNNFTNEIEFLKNEKFSNLSDIFFEEFEKVIDYPKNISDIVIKTHERENTNIDQNLINEKEKEIFNFIKQNLLRINPQNNYTQKQNSFSSNNEEEKFSCQSVLSSEFFEIFFKSYVDVSNFEFVQISVIHIMTEILKFDEFGNYINLFTYENCKKLKDPKNLDLIRKKFTEKKELNLNFIIFLANLMLNYYKFRKNKFVEQSAVNCFIQKRSRHRSKNRNNFIKFTKDTANRISALNELSLISKNNHISSGTNPYSISINIDATQDSTRIIEDSSLTKKELDTQEQKDAFNQIISTIFLACRMKCMNELDLSQNQILPDSMPMLLAPLKANNTIKKLDLSYNRIGAEGCWELGRIFLNNNALHELDLSNTGLTDEHLAYFPKALEDGITSLIKLNLSNNILTAQSGRLIAGILDRSPNLAHLNISKCHLEEGADYILMVILDKTKANMCRLTELLATGIKIQTKSLVMLSEIVAEIDCSLNSLVLSDNKLECEVGKLFFRKMKMNKSITELIMMKCGIGDSLADNVYDMLESNNTLISLSLYDNKINDREKFVKILSLCQNFDKTAQRGIIDMNLNEINFYNDIDSKSGRNILRNLDLSKNRCRLNLNDEFLIDIIRNLDIDMLDISGNVEIDNVSNSFAEAVINIQNSTKIIY